MRIDHMGFSVSSIERSLEFFCGRLGLEATSVTDLEGEAVERIIGMPGVKLRMVMVNLPGDKNIELLEYVQPVGEKLDLRTCNAGVAHLALEVDDIDSWHRKLTASGIQFMGPPVWVATNGGKLGVCYLKGPDDITIELIDKNSGNRTTGTGDHA